jgi:type VI secretion system secreted protein Hcp
MRGNRVRSRTVVGTAAASAAAVVALVLGPAGVPAAAAAGPADPSPRYVEAAAVDYFLKIDGIEGESADRRHKGEIQIDSFSWGVSNPSSIGSGSGGAGAGKVSYSDLSFTAMFGKHSPQLVRACATGKHFPEAVLTGRKAGGGQQEYLKIELKDVLVSSYATGGTSSEPTDAVELAYASATVSHMPPPTTAPTATGTGRPTAS